MSYSTASSSVVSPKFQPARKAARLASRIGGLAANFSSIHSTVVLVGRPYMNEISPSAKRFLARWASAGLMPSMPSVDRTVSVVIGTRMTW